MEFPKTEAYAHVSCPEDTDPDRFRRFKQLMLKYWIPANLDGPWRVSNGEDCAEYLRGDDTLNRWAAVTMHGDEYYVRPDYDSRESAESSASIEFVTDDIFQESPVAICDLDSDEEPWGKLYVVDTLVPTFVPAYPQADETNQRTSI